MLGQSCIVSLFSPVDKPGIVSLFCPVDKGSLILL